MNCEQRYNNALKRARIGLHDCNLLDCDNMTRKAVITTIYHLFPELTESDDERVRKGIIRNLQYLMDRSEGFVKEDLQERIAWLEKQGEQTTDKVEPKFKVGDFITNDYCLGKVIEITNDAYLLDTGQGIPFSCENTHLWTINDAKDGDVLVDEDNNIGLYSGEKDDLDWHSCVYLGCDDYFRGSMGYHKHKNTKPATKEQRDLLFKKMKEAGYEWYSEKKELKKIVSQKTLDPDRVIAWLVANICDYDYYVKLFKKDFGI